VEEQAEKSGINLGQRGEIGKCDPFVDLVHRLPDEPELGNRATGLDEACVGGAAGSTERGSSPGNLADRLGEALTDYPGRDQERFAADRHVEGVIAADLIEPFSQPAL